MTQISVKKLDEATLSVRCDPGPAQELSEYFSYRPDGYRFHPKFKAKIWDGYVRMYSRKDPTLHAGLANLLEKFCRERGYELVGDPHGSRVTPDEADVRAFVEQTPVFIRGVRKRPHGYQVDAVVDAISTGRRILESPTGSGKSLIAYLVLRYFLSRYPGFRMVLVVPTVALVNQMADDFRDYSSGDPTFDVDEVVHKISAGIDKEVDRPLVVTTWQSVFQLDREWFLKFDGCIMDEAHLVKAQSLVTIALNLKNAWLRIGMSGSVEDTKVNRLVLAGVLGPIKVVAETKDLMDEGFLSDMRIEAVRLDYPESDRKALASVDRGVDKSTGKRIKTPATYAEEVAFVEEHEGRMRAVVALAMSGEGRNGLLLFRKKAHGEAMFAAVRDSLPEGMNAYILHGDVDPDTRERIRKDVDSSLGNVLVASYGVFSTGINIRNLHWAAFAAPLKASTIIRQSIGRILRKSDDGTTSVMFDLIDDLSWKRRECFCVRHAASRFRTYISQRWKVTTRSLKVRSG